MVLTATGPDDELAIEEEQHTCERRFFEENEQIHQIIQEIVAFPCPVDPESERQAVEAMTQRVHRFQTILNWYMEQSQLLDPHLRAMVQPIMAAVQAEMRRQHMDDSDSDVAMDSEQHMQRHLSPAFPFQLHRNPKLHKLFQLIYHLCRVRGFKTILKLFPHEVADFEPTLQLLQSQDRMDHSTWESRYVLLLWMSMLCLVPFDLISIDSSVSASTEAVPSHATGSIVANIITLCKGYLGDPGATQAAAALCLARLLSRPDMEASYLTKFLHWANEQLVEAYKQDDIRSEQFKITGIILCLAQIAKFAPRELHASASKIYFHSVMRFIDRMTEEDARDDRPSSSSTLHRKLSVKLVQRLGLLYLPQKVMRWRYQRGLRSLEINLQAFGTHKPESLSYNQLQQHHRSDEDESLASETLDQLEQIVEVLLCGLRDRDTVVRWSAAKGIGRITGRLPLEYADDIVQSVLELFVVTERAGAWHGASLALAELARRGVLLPERLHEAVSCVARALHDDVRVGANSIGSHVRDAACYACWSFARAYEPALLLPHLRETLAPAMLITCVFDRELNCRRAASAAFQENVGRQGRANFPHGIDLLTRADYFSVSNLRQAFLDVSFFVGSFPEYRYSLLQHLIEAKLGHWDVHIRVLASIALAKIGSLDSFYSMAHIVPLLVKRCLSTETDVAFRHGAILALAHLLIALACKPTFIDGEVQTQLKALPLEIDSHRLFRGRGGELVRAAICNLIESLAISNATLTVLQIKKYLALLEECIGHPKDEVRAAAIEAFRAFSQQYMTKILARGTETHTRICFDFIERCVNSKIFLDGQTATSLNPNVAARKGYLRAIGASPSSLIKGQFDQCLQAIDRSLDYESQTNDERNAESRVEAIRALTDFCCRAEFQDLLEGKEDEIIRILLRSIESDYEIDDRGDVGSWVRREAMHALGILLCSESDEDRSQTEMMIGSVVNTQYGAGRIVRVLVGDILKTVGLQSSTICHVQFDADTIGHFFFGSTHTGIFRLSTASTSSSSENCDLRCTLKPPHNLKPKLRFAGCVSTKIVAEVCCALSKQLAEKLDVVRQTAGQVLFELIHTENVRGVPRKQELMTGPFHSNLSINWSMAHDTFPLVAALLDYPEYIYSVVAGMVVSIGGLTESVVKASQSALFEWLQSKLARNQTVEICRFGRILIDVFRDHANDDRVIIPLMKTFSVLLEAELITCLFTGDDSGSTEKQRFGEELYDCLRNEIQKSTMIPKVSAGIAVLAGVLPSDTATQEKALRALIMFLGHRFPRVRKIAAEKLYTRLLLHEEIIPESMYDQALETLSTGVWDGTIAQARNGRNRLLDILELEKPKPKSAAVPAPSNSYNDDNYQTLVKEMGY